MTSGLRLAILLLLLLPVVAEAQPPAPMGLTTWIAELSSLDYPTRMTAARRIRRVPAAEAVPALVEAVRRHSDQFVRYRALVVLTGFNDRDTPDLMREAMRDRNDRVREVAYKWFEEHPDPMTTRAMLDALQTEEAEFVRPALVAALAARGADAQVQRALVIESGRGLDFFRSAVIEALGRHRARYAAKTLVGMLGNDGPLRDDVVLALGRIGDPETVPALEALSGMPADVQLAVRAALCLLGRECDAHLKALTVASTTASDRAIARAAISAIAAIALAGRPTAIDELSALAASRPALRNEVAVAFGGVAIRQPDLVIVWLDRASPEIRSAALDLLKDGFDSLEEDFGEEQFFGAARASYWKAADGSASRALLAALIERLEF